MIGAIILFLIAFVMIVILLAVVIIKKDPILCLPMLFALIPIVLGMKLLRQIPTISDVEKGTAEYLVIEHVVRNESGDTVSHYNTYEIEWKVEYPNGGHKK